MINLLEPLKKFTEYVSKNDKDGYFMAGVLFLGTIIGFAVTGYFILCP